MIIPRAGGYDPQPMKGAVVTAAVVLAIGGASVARSVWQGTSTGPASARVAASGQFEVDSAAPPGAPGGPPATQEIRGPGGSGSGSVLVKNLSNVAMTVTSWQVPGTNVNVADASGCDASNFAFPSGPQTVDRAIAANGQARLDLLDAITLDPAAPSACAGANVTYDVEITVTQGS
jgi:hypothetical protein